jgi:hypothetical protein
MVSEITSTRHPNLWEQRKGSHIDKDWASVHPITGQGPADPI